MIFQGEKMFDASFDIFANNYDDVRPGYPKEMYEDIAKICKLRESSSVIEIGAGSGIATIELAKTGCKIVGIEPGSNLVAIAKEKTKGCPNVEIVEAMFEDYESSGKFDCLIALTSFHWISEQAKYKKAYDLLNQNGHFVIVWNSFFQSDGEATKEVNSLYHEMLSDIYPKGNNDVNLGVFSKLNGRELEIVGSDMFYLYFSRKYVTVYNYDKETYPMLLNTFPKIIKVEKERREKFLKRVGEIVEKHGTLSVPVLTTLLITKKKDVFLDEIGKA